MREGPLTEPSRGEENGDPETSQAEKEASIRRREENCWDPKDFAVHNCSNTAIIADTSNDARGGDFHAIDDETEPETDAAAQQLQQLQDRPIVISLQTSTTRRGEQERERGRLPSWRGQGRGEGEKTY